MSVQTITEKAVADQMGALVLENIKLKALIAAFQQENSALKLTIEANAKEIANEVASEDGVAF